MNLNQFSFLLTILFFTSTAILILINSRERKVLKKYEVVVLISLAIFIPYTLTEYFALQWGAWFYLPQGSFDIKLGAEVETYLFSALTAFIVASITLVSAWHTDKKLAAKKRKSVIKAKKNKLLSLKPRRASRAVGFARR